jgi:hypothetical protein
MNHLHFLGCGKDTLFRKQRHFSPKYAQSAQMPTREQTHKMHPHPQSPHSQNPNPKKSQVSRAKSQPSQQFPWREKRRVVRHPQRFDQGRNGRKPKCDQFATSRHSHGFLAKRHAGPRGCKKRFLGEAACRTLALRLFARERDNKRKKPPFVRRSSKAEKRGKHQPIYVVLQNPD